jgi:hypothetical protein
MLVAVLWTRAVPEAAARVALQGDEGLELLRRSLPPALARRPWAGAARCCSRPARPRWCWCCGGSGCCCGEGLLAQTPFSPGPICARALERGQAISLVNLALYPGRAEFDSLLPELPAVLIQPLANQGLLLVGGWSPRCFSRSDLIWVEGWGKRLTTEMPAHDPERAGARSQRVPSRPGAGRRNWVCT